MDRPSLRAPFRCVLHGSFRKHFTEIQYIRRLFEAAGITVLAPNASSVSDLKDGFVRLESDRDPDPRMIELQYLHHLVRLGECGFSYFVDPEGYIGKSASYELGIAQVSNVRCFFSDPIKDHPAYLHKNSIWKPELLVEYILEKGELPPPQVSPDENKIHKLWEQFMVPGSVVAVGGVIEYHGADAKKEKEILLVKTHKWGNRWSMIGGKVRRHERLREALAREIMEESGLRSEIHEHICTFDQIRNSGYYQTGVQHIFVDNVVKVGNKKVQLNEEAEDYLWVPARVALRDLDIEPNARRTVVMYADRFCR